MDRDWIDDWNDSVIKESKSAKFRFKRWINDHSKFLKFIISPSLAIIGLIIAYLQYLKEVIPIPNT